MRVLGASFAKKSETIDSTPEFLAEVLRRNPQDETPHVTLMEGERPSLGVFAAIVASGVAISAGEFGGWALWPRYGAGAIALAVAPPSGTRSLSCFNHSCRSLQSGFELN